MFYVIYSYGSIGDEKVYDTYPSRWEAVHAADSLMKCGGYAYVQSEDEHAADELIKRSEYRNRSADILSEDKPRYEYDVSFGHDGGRFYMECEHGDYSFYEDVWEDDPYEAFEYLREKIFQLCDEHGLDPYALRFEFDGTFGEDDD